MAIKTSTLEISARKKATIQRQYFNRLIYENLSFFKKFCFYFYFFSRGLVDLLTYLNVIILFHKWGLLSWHSSVRGLLWFFDPFSGPSLLALRGLTQSILLLLKVLLDRWIYIIISKTWLVPTYNSCANVSANTFIDNEVFTSAAGINAIFGVYLGEFFNSDPFDYTLLNLKNKRAFAYFLPWGFYGRSVLVDWLRNRKLAFDTHKKFLCSDKPFLFLLDLGLRGSSYLVAGLGAIFFCKRFRVPSAFLTARSAELESEQRAMGVAQYNLNLASLLNSKQYWKYDLAKIKAAKSQNVFRKIEVSSQKRLVCKVMLQILGSLESVIIPVVIGALYRFFSFLEFVIGSRQAPLSLSFVYCLDLYGVLCGLAPFLYFQAHRNAYAQRCTSTIELFSSFYDVSMAVGFKNEEVLKIKSSTELKEPVKFGSPQTISFSFKDLTYRLKEKVILNRVSLNLEKGHYLLIGKNGGGKTTFSNILMGHLRLDSKENPNPSFVFKVDGIDKVLNTPELLRDHVLVLDQKPNFFGTTLLENLILDLRPTKQVLDQLKSLMKELDLNRDLQVLIDPLNVPFSGGQIKKIELIRAILTHKYKNFKFLIILDQILAGVDVGSCRTMKKLFSKYFGNTLTIEVTHELSEFSDDAKVIFLYANTLSQTTLKKLKESSAYQEYCNSF